MAANRLLAVTPLPFLECAFPMVDRVWRLCGFLRRPLAMGISSLVASAGLHKIEIWQVACFGRLPTAYRGGGTSPCAGSAQLAATISDHANDNDSLSQAARIAIVNDHGKPV